MSTVPQPDLTWHKLFRLPIFYIFRTNCIFIISKFMYILKICKIYLYISHWTTLQFLTSPKQVIPRCSNHCHPFPLAELVSDKTVSSTAYLETVFSKNTLYVWYITVPLKPETCVFNMAPSTLWLLKNFVMGIINAWVKLCLLTWRPRSK